MNDTCETCRFSVNPDERVGGEPGIRRCKRFPPTVVTSRQWGIFPMVDKGDWCGEYEKG